MSYGLPYMGSKSRIADKILDLIPPGEVFVDLFAGGCAVTHAAILRKQYRRYIVNDITDYPDLFLRACRGEIKMEQARWISREEFHAQKETDPLIRLLWSFGNCGNFYSYPQEIEPYKRAVFALLTAQDLPERLRAFRKTIEALFRYLREESGGALTLLQKQDKSGKVAERFAYRGGGNDERKSEMETAQSLSRLESLDALTRLGRMAKLSRLARVAKLNGIALPAVYRLDYRAVSIPPGAIVYADPPYAGAGEYEGAKGFDSAAFFDWARACPHPVFFSEYSAPQDFALIASFEVAKLFTCGRRNETYATERLYANPPALALFKEARRDLFTEETL